MGHANQEHRVLSRLRGRFLHGAARMLFEQIVDVLNAGHVPLADAIDAFIKPADGRSERDAVVANLSVRLKLLERRPDCIVIHLLHANVMQLQQIDSVRLQTLQRGVGRTDDGFRRKILRNLTLTAATRVTVSHKIVADLRRDHDLIALVREGFRD
jgi:hypothetical protein